MKTSHIFCNRAPSQVRICRPVPSLPLPLSFAPIFMKDALSAESNEMWGKERKKCILDTIFDQNFNFWHFDTHIFLLHFFLSYGWLYLQFTKNLLTAKIYFFTENMRIALKVIFNFSVFFVRLSVFEIWLILYVVDFEVIWPCVAMQKTWEIFANLI